MVRCGWIVGLSIACAASLLATTIVPVEISSRGSGDGATDRWSINCLFKTSGDPGLIQCYVTLKAPEQESVSVNLHLKKEGKTIASVPVAGHFMRERGNGHLFNFALSPDTLAESEIDIHTAGGFFRIETGTVEIVDAEAVP